MYVNSSNTASGGSPSVVDVNTHINPTFDADDNTYDSCSIGIDTQANVPNHATRDMVTRQLAKSVRTIKFIAFACLVGLVVLVGASISTISQHSDIITKVDIIEEELLEAKKNSELNNIASESPLANLPRTCADVSGSNPRQVAVLFDGTKVLCDTATDGGGWLVFQRRTSNETDFYRGWEDYKAGFGDINGNFWMGLEAIHDLTSRRRYELRVDLMYDGRPYFASYDNFMVSSEADKYRLTVSFYNGDAGDNLGDHYNQPFSTKDQDNDAGDVHCAQKYHGGWWYRNCHQSNLNGEWGSKEGSVGVIWTDLTTYYDSATATEMKMRPL